MLKTLGRTESKAQPNEGGVGVGDNRARCDGSRLNKSRINNGEVDSGEIRDNEVRKKVQKLSKFKNLAKSQKMVESEFLTPRAKLAFTKLRQAFVKAPILYHFDPEGHIRIETDASDYAIGGVFSQIILNDLGRWHPVAFFTQKIIPAETRYQTHNGELLAILKAFKTWRHYLERFQHEVLIVTEHNKLHQLMDTKSLSSRQVRWAQKLSHYHFWIDYCQSKANGAADALFQYLQQSAEEEKTLRAKNVKILHCLQSLLARVFGLSASQPSQLSPLRQIFICETTIFFQLRQFWDFF